MIDLSKLDKSLTYVGYQIGKGAISRAIQIKSKMLVETEIPTLQIASHVFALVFQNGGWYVFESHLKWGGVKRLLFSEWIKNEIPENNFVFPYSLEIQTLQLYADFNPHYSMGAIGKIAFSRFSDVADESGMICSEYVATAMVDHKPCYKFNVAPWETIPLHIQLLEKG